MLKRKNEAFKIGRFKFKRKKVRRQGETVHFKSNGFKTILKPAISIVAIISMIAVAITVGFNMVSRITYTNRLTSKAEKISRDYKSMVVLESSTGRILEGYNENEKLPMASTTKIATAIIAIEQISDLNQKFVVPDNAVGVEGSSMYLKRGEELTMEEYLYGLMLPSGNDSAVAIANIVAGSEEKFAVMMNELAQKLGLINTNFVTASGLHDNDHYTTSLDLAKLTSYAMKNEKFRKIVSTGSIKITGVKPDEPRILKNKQKLMKDEDLMIEGIEVTGVKSGFTPEAGRCLVTSAQKNGMEVVVVVLNAPNMFETTKELLISTFNDYKLVNVIEAKKHITKIPVNKSEGKQVNLYSSQGFSYPLTVEEEATIKVNYSYPEYLSAPVKKDQEVGSLKVILNGITLFETPILTIEEIEDIYYGSIVNKILENFK